MKTSCSVNYHGIGALCHGRLHRIVGTRSRIRAHLLTHDINPSPLRPNHKLVNGSGPERIRGPEHDLFPGSSEFSGNLSYCGGFADTVHTHDENDIRLLGCVYHPLDVRASVRNRCPVNVKKLGNLIPKHLCKLFKGNIPVPADTLLKVVDNLQGCVYAHIRLHQSLLHGVQYAVVNAGLSDYSPRKLLEETPIRVFYSLVKNAHSLG